LINKAYFNVVVMGIIELTTIVLRGQPGQRCPWPPAIQPAADGDVSIFVTKINARTNDGYWCQLVARLVPESPKPLVQKAKINNAHADK
jgi:hypothetical protein